MFFWLKSSSSAVDVEECEVKSLVSCWCGRVDRPEDEEVVTTPRLEVKGGGFGVAPYLIPCPKLFQRTIYNNKEYALVPYHRLLGDDALCNYFTLLG